MTNPATGPVRLEDAVAFLHGGMARDEHALANRKEQLEKLASQFEVDPSLLDLIALANQVLEQEEIAYSWLMKNHPLLERRSPAQAILDGDADQVRKLLNNIQHGLPV